MIYKAFGPISGNRIIRLKYKELAYFYPTFPRKSWVDNLTLIRSVLEAIKKENPETYDEIAVTIYQAF